MPEQFRGRGTQRFSISEMWSVLLGDDAQALLLSQRVKRLAERETESSWK